MSNRAIIPVSFGYAEAVAREQLVRDASFLTVNGDPLPESIAGFDVWPMNLRHFLALRLAANPVLFGQSPTLEQLAQFIWTVSTAYKPSTTAQVQWFKASGFIEPRKPRIQTQRAMFKWSQKMADCILLQVTAMEACYKYVTESLQDRPRGKGPGGPSYYSDACFWCAVMGREYGMSIPQVMEMPLKQLFQFLNELKDHNGKQASMVNPSNEALAAWQASQQGKN